MRPSEIDIAWAAGLFEAQGQIRFIRSQVHLKIGGLQLDVAARFHNIVQYGSIRASRTGSYEWNCGRLNDCREIVVWLWPHLSGQKKTRWEQVLTRRYQVYVPRSCPNCGDMFEPIRKDQVCCSGRCSLIYTKKVGKYTDRGERNEDG